MRRWRRRGARAHRARKNPRFDACACANPFDSLLVDAPRLICTFALDAIRAPKIEAECRAATTRRPAGSKRHGKTTGSRKERSIDRRLGGEVGIGCTSFSAPPLGGRVAGTRAARTGAHRALSPATARAWTTASPGTRDTGSARFEAPSPDCFGERFAGASAPVCRNRINLTSCTKDLTE
jgi:hypothetical protein